MPDKLLLAAVTIALVAAASFVYASFSSSQQGTGQGIGQQTTTHVVPLDQIVSGGPPPDGIPSIDNPKFVSAAGASAWLNDAYDSVIGISINGEVRAYPLQILVWHEIVNDVVGGVPVAVTYCPLCYTTQAFVRQINGTTVTFGTSGRLYNNNLVMYDRLTKSLWSEAWGQAIEGTQTGHILQRVPIDVTTWGAWKKLYPNTLVLSRDTGFSRDYGDDPYGNYYYTKGVYFPLSYLDKRLPEKAVVLGLIIGGSARAYEVVSPYATSGVPYTLVNQTSPLLTDSVGGRQILTWQSGQIVRFFDPVVDGQRLTFTGGANGTIMDTQTRSVWNFDGVALAGPLKGMAMSRYVSESAFWFTWGAFYPDTSLYTP